MSDISSKLLGRVGAKKKNILIWGGIGLLVVGFIVSIYTGIDMKSALEAANHKQEDIPELTEMESKNEKQESWSIDMENRLDSLKDEQQASIEKSASETKEQIVESNKFMLADIQKDNQRLMARMDEVARMKSSSNENIGGIPLPRGNRIRPKYDNGNVVELPGLVPMSSMGKPQTTNINKAQAQHNGNAGDDDLLGQINIIPGKNGTPNSQFSQSGQAESVKKRQLYYSKAYTNTFADVNKTSSKHTSGAGEAATYEVVTGFTDAYMVTGAYAPLMIGRGSSGSNNGSDVGSFGSSSAGSTSSGTGSQANVPILLEAHGDAIFPNRTLGSIDKCMLIGTSTGNASSATIDIRLDKMTCLFHGGKKVIDGKISGWVVSEVGTPGIPATMVYRAGDYIGRVIASGVLEGLSQSLVAAASPVGNGGSSQVFTGAQNGASTGVSNAFSKLSDFYLGLAEATLPTLEAKGGRYVSIILSGGDKFTVRDINLLDTRNVDKYVNKFIGAKK